MTQLDDLQAFVNFELPRRTVLLTVAITSFDGDPNGGGAPAVIVNSPLGTFYLQETPDTLWRKNAAGDWVNVSAGGGGAAVTTGDITFTMSLSGTDPVSPILITTQAEADAHGDFLTVPGAMDTLPDSLLHKVTFEFPDGNWLLGTDILGNMSRFNFLQIDINKGGIIFNSINGIIAEPAQPTMAVSSSDGLGAVTMQADPGFSANQFRAFHLEVISGTGAGQFKPIRSHATTAFSVAGEFSPALDATSVARISRPAAGIQFAQDFPVLRTEIMDINSGLIQFLNIDLVPNSGLSILELKGGTYMLSEGSRSLGMLIQLTQCNLLHNTCIITGIQAGFPLPAIGMQASLFRTATGSSKPALLLGFGATHSSEAISLGGSGGGQGGQGMGTNAFIFGSSAFDGWDQSLLTVISQFSIVRIEPSGAFPKSDGAATVAVKLIEGGRALFSDVAGFAASTFAGTSDDFNLDGTLLTWADLDGDADKTIFGSRLSGIQERQ